MFHGTVTLEPSSEQMRALLALAARHVVAHVSSLNAQPTCDDSNLAELVARLREPLPEHGSACEPLLELVFNSLVQKGYNTGCPGALSYVNGGGLFHAAVADLIIAAINPYVAYWGSSPGFAELEQTVIRWFCAMIGLPSTAGGVLVSGGSTANLSAILAARRTQLGTDFAKGTLYASDQLHHSLLKAAMIAGFPDGAIRLLPTDASYRLRPDALLDAIARDRRAGLVPFCILATAGTTNSGAIDPLSRLAEIAQSERMWLHVDAAYGGFFALTERGRTALAGIERADSVTMDPHKSLFLPFGTGCLLARDVQLLKRAHQLPADYMRGVTDLSEEAEAVNFGDLSVEMSRNARGLRVWLPLKLLGVEAFRAALDEKLELARWACAEVAALGFDVVAEPALSTFAFRARAPGSEGARQDELNRRILARVNASGRAHLSATQLSGRFTLRMCILSFRTHREAVAACLSELAQALRAELGKGGAKPSHALRDEGPVIQA